MAVYTVELTEAAYQSCRTKPSARLLLTLLSLKPGDGVEVVGEEFFYPSQHVKKILLEEGLSIEHEESDGLMYRIVARKPSA